MVTAPSIRLQRSCLRDGKLLFEQQDGFDQALSDGFFALKLPHDANLEPGYKFAREFYKADTGEPQFQKYRGYRNRHDIYFDRSNHQVEHVLTDNATREQYFPAELTIMVNSMLSLALCVLQNTLSQLGIPPSDQRIVTNGAAVGDGTHWFVTHHYRTELPSEGCAPHQDTGFLTVLACDQPGLEVHNHIGWQPLLPEPGYFIVNFGKSFEILTQRMKRPVKASFHRVRRYLDTDPGGDRVSFAAFIDPPLDTWLQQIEADGTVTRAVSVQQFLADNNRRTWDGDHPDFGMLSSPQTAN